MSTSESRAEDRILDGPALLDSLAQIVDPLSQAWGPGCEVVLHDLSNLDHSVYAIGGDLTGRAIGSPPTDLLLQHVLEGARANVIGYETVLPDGRRCRSSTIFVRLPSVPQTRPVAALCINIDMTQMQELHALASSLVGALEDSIPARAGIGRRREAFHNTIDSLASEIVTSTIKDIGVPVHLMKKGHKVDVISALKSCGIFQLKGAVDIVASALDVSRFTIYNYLNELQETDSEDAR